MGPVRSRKTSAISASATTHRALAVASFGPKPRGAPQQFLRAREVAELRHRDAAQGKRRRIVAQRDLLQRGQRITCRKCAGRGGDLRVHGNPVTPVTLTRFRFALISRSTSQRSGMTTIDREPANDNVLGGKHRKRAGLAGAQRGRLA
jgi:hypothetical protein